MIVEQIREFLFEQQDQEYAAFQRKLIPSILPDAIIGVRTPILRKYAKELAKREDVCQFLEAVPHIYFEENQLHAFLISNDKEYHSAIEAVESFLPYVDNWATCDQMSPKVFRKNLPDLLGHIRQWLASDHVYTIRFGIGMLMQHYLEEEFAEEYPEMVAAVSSEEYYVNMMIAWYFATALAKQYEVILPFIKEHRLERFTHNKTIQKAVESNRITPQQKEQLKGYR